MNQPNTDELVIPDHMNQFHELTPAGLPGDPWPPLWGRNYNGLNCAYTVGALVARFATRGKWKPAPNDLRELAQDHEGGAMPRDIRRALQRSGKVDPADIWMPRWGLSWDRVMAHRANGRYVWLATDYELIPDSKSCQPDFDGDHAIGLPPIPMRDGNKLGYDDPLCNRLKYVDAAVIRRAAQKVAREFGSPGLIVLLAKQPPAKPKPSGRIEELERMLDEANSRLAAIAELAAPVNSLEDIDPDEA